MQGYVTAGFLNFQEVRFVICLARTSWRYLLYLFGSRNEQAIGPSCQVGSIDVVPKAFSASNRVGAKIIQTGRKSH